MAEKKEKLTLESLNQEIKKLKIAQDITDEDIENLEEDLEDLQEDIEDTRIDEGRLEDIEDSIMVIAETVGDLKKKVTSNTEGAFAVVLSFIAFVVSFISLFI